MKEILEKQVEIEHKKLKALWTAFTIAEVFFMILAVISPFVIMALGNWAGDDFNRRKIGMLIGFVYTTFNAALAILFQNLAFYKRDDLLIVGHTKDYDTIWKYKSEVLAERKMKERGTFYPDGVGNIEGK